jgi:hypothetical protein
MESQHVEEAPAPRPALPLLALLALASALGIAVAIALAALAMLLAAPAYAEDGGEGGLLLERGARLVWAQRVSAESEAGADGYTRVIEIYQNPYPEALSGVYLHRLPRHAVLERLAFALGEAEPLPALLTLRQGSALVERTVEIGPGETLLVELAYRTAGPRRLLVRCCCC